jgi:AAA domain
VLRLLRFWYCLESLTPAEFSSKLTEPEVKDKWSIKLGSTNQSLPWTNKNKAASPLYNEEEVQRYEYQIFHSIFNTEDISTCLKSLLDCDDDLAADLARAEPKQACYQSFKVDHQGFLVEGSLTTAITPWVLKQITADYTALDRKQWAQEFRQYKQARCLEFTYKSSQLRQWSMPVTIDLLQELQQNRNEVWYPPALEGLAWIVARYKSKQSENAVVDIKFDIAKLNIEEEESRTLEPFDILNSPYLEDLERVFGAFSSCSVGAALSAYLNSTETGGRIDLGRIETLQRLLSPALIPLGRWASAPTQPLALMQQCAVNLEMTYGKEQLKLFSVNGPPGTGKTTMLRDVVATLLVQRAEKLTQFEKPGHAFQQIGSILIKSGKTKDIYQLDSGLTGFEIVVASSNNGAVENISKELPLKSSIADEYHEQAGYFYEVARNVFRDEEVWGLISAVLGNSKNRNKFKNRFLYERPDRSNRYSNQTDPSHSEEDSNRISLSHYLHTQWEFSFDREWQQAVQEFKRAQQKVLSLQGQRLDSENRLKQLATVTKELEVVQAYLVETQEQLEHLESECRSSRNRLHDFERAVGEADLHSGLIARSQPPWWMRLLAWVWKHPRVLSYERLQADARCRAVTLRNQAAEANRCLLAQEQALMIKKFEFQRLQQQQTQHLWQVEECHKMLQISAQQLGTIPELAWWSRPEDDIQVAAPWLDTSFNDARNQLFLAAVQVHAYFILCAKKQIQSSLYVWAQALDNQLIKAKYILPAWQIFFLVVPVVSSTFASIEPMFRGLGQETLGYLLIDEAGQAIPQAAVGAIWRAQQVMVVGDPLQVEPVVTLGQQVIEQLGSYFDIDSQWSPAETSVQRLADRANPYGSYLSVNNEPLWVGCPLRVHRRCMNPMFSIANEIAYENKMVLPKQMKDPDLVFPLGSSKWIHIEGQCHGKHWVPEQGEATLRLLDQLINTSDPSSDLTEPPKIYVISPFRDVAMTLRSKVADRWKNKFSDHKLQKWIKRSIGTVHTFQGKEEDAVILLLGADHQTRAAAAWAASKPNILNVAVTRARYRLYIVGDRTLWGKLPYFDVALQKLSLEE